MAEAGIKEIPPSHDEFVAKLNASRNEDQARFIKSKITCEMQLIGSAAASPENFRPPTLTPGLRTGMRTGPRPASFDPRGITIINPYLWSFGEGHMWSAIRNYSPEIELRGKTLLVNSRDSQFLTKLRKKRTRIPTINATWTRKRDGIMVWAIQVSGAYFCDEVSNYGGFTTYEVNYERVSSLIVRRPWKEIFG
jgi:hypothetical protein